MKFNDGFLFAIFCFVFLGTSGVFAQIDPGIGDLLTGDTGEMTVEIDMEITARIAACHKSGDVVSEAEFNELKAPYNVTNVEYGAFHWQHLAWGMTDNPLLRVYMARVAELKANGCKFGTVVDPGKAEGCYDDDGDDPNRSSAVYVYKKSAQKDDCDPCEYKDVCAGDKKLTEYVCKIDKKDCKKGCLAEAEHNCQYGCLNGRCLTEKESKEQLCGGQCLAECPAGTVDTGETGCPLRPKIGTFVNDSFTWEYYPQEKCCVKSDVPLPENGTCLGMCAQSPTCPEGYENTGKTACPQDENCYKCGMAGNWFANWFGWLKIFTCCDYAPKTCCVAKPDAPPIAPKEKCAGYYSQSKCMSNYVINAKAESQPDKNCHSCGDMGFKKCCEYVPTVCCQLPAPITECLTGMCTAGECPSGTMNVGAADCGKIKECKTGCAGFCKKCGQKTAKCCMAENYAKCDKGTCQESGECPAGQKSIGMADCGSYDDKFHCGFLNFGSCKEPVPKTCCVPE